MRVHFDALEIDSFHVSGVKGYWLSDYRDIVIRRRGPRTPVAGEEQFLSKRQEAADKREAAWREQYRAWTLRERLARRGRDAVAARGTAPLQAQSGVHTWRLRWHHAPARGGAADAVGLVAEGCERFGPCAYPCLGAGEEAGSLGLHASGELVCDGNRLALATRGAGAVWASAADRDEKAVAAKGKRAEQTQAFRRKQAQPPGRNPVGSGGVTGRPCLIEHHILHSAAHRGPVDL